MNCVGLDIGGANIKAADNAGRAISRPFDIWKDPDRLPSELESLLRTYPDAEQIAVTLTAELADCFATKSIGVDFLLRAVERSVQSTCADRQDLDRMIKVWSTEGRFLSTAEAREKPMSVAAANWHGLATWSGRLAPRGAAVLVDIGSTTTDMIPLRDGRPVALGLTDLGRLQSGELSYSAVSRTPLCAIAHSVPFRDSYCPLAAELFATMLDVYLLLGQIPEDAANCHTANGKPATKNAAYDRIVRNVCCDRDEVSFDEALQMARFLADVQRQRLAGSLERVTQRLSEECSTVILSGSGEFLARQLVSQNRRTANARQISLTDQFTQDVAQAACAFAIAQLASEQIEV